MSYDPRPHPPLVDEPPFPASAYLLPVTPDCHGLHLRTSHYGVDGALSGGLAPLAMARVLGALHATHEEGVRLRTPCARGGNPWWFGRTSCRDWHTRGFPRGKGSCCHHPRPSP